MRNRHDMAIGVLTITAVILLVGTVLVFTGSQNQALAIGQTDRGGDYIVVTGQFTENDEIIYVTDAAAQRMNVYSYDWNRGGLVLWDTHDLKRTLAGPAPRKKNNK